MSLDIERRLQALERFARAPARPQGHPLAASFLALPGLVGFWPLSSVQRSSGGAYDLSGQARALTYNGNPVYNVHNSTTPYIDLDGTGDYLSRADETDLDIAGTETIYASGLRGLTFGGWFWTDSVSANSTLLAKWNPTGNQRGYILNVLTTFTLEFGISVDGTASVTASSVVGSHTNSSWWFIACRFTPSTEMKIYYNQYTATNTTSIPASAFVNTANLTIGARSDAAQLVDGRAACCFLSANAIPDAIISQLFQQTRGWFGV